MLAVGIAAIFLASIEAWFISTLSGNDIIGLGLLFMGYW